MYIVTADVCIIYQPPFRELPSLFGATFRAKYLHVVCLNYALWRRNRYPTRINNADGANSIISVWRAGRGAARQTEWSRTSNTFSRSILLSHSSQNKLLCVHKSSTDVEGSFSSRNTPTLNLFVIWIFVNFRSLRVGGGKIPDFKLGWKSEDAVRPCRVAALIK